MEIHHHHSSRVLKDAALHRLYSLCYSSLERSAAADHVASSINLTTLQRQQPSPLFSLPSEASAKKRPHSSCADVITSQEDRISLLGSPATPRPRSSNSRGPPRKRFKQPPRKSAIFSSSVTVRLFFRDDDASRTQRHAVSSSSSPSPSSSLLFVSHEEVEMSKDRARSLAALHYRRRMRSPKPDLLLAAASVEQVSRFECDGESMRGLEHMTDAANGRERKKRKAEAIRSVVSESQRMLLDQALLLRFSMPMLKGGQSVASRMLRLDTSKLADAYRSKTKEATVFARRVANEDAEVAASILAEDLQ